MIIIIILKPLYTDNNYNITTSVLQRKNIPTIACVKFNQRSHY